MGRGERDGEGGTPSTTNADTLVGHRACDAVQTSLSSSYKRR